MAPISVGLLRAIQLRTRAEVEIIERTASIQPVGSDSDEELQIVPPRIAPRPPREEVPPPPPSSPDHLRRGCKIM